LPIVIIPILFHLITGRSVLFTKWLLSETVLPPQENIYQVFDMETGELFDDESPLLQISSIRYEYANGSQESFESITSTRQIMENLPVEWGEEGWKIRLEHLYDEDKLQEEDVFSEEEIKYLQEDLENEARLEEESEEDRIQKSMVKEVLLNELDFSIDSFLSTAREYYKKGIENTLGIRFNVKTNTFLKFVYLFCDKRDIPFFFPSYSYLLKIIEFLDVEMPSSTDIENYISKLANEYVDISIPEDIREELHEALSEKFNNNNSQKPVNEEDIESRISSIPLPPEKGIDSSEIKEGDNDD